MHGLQAPVEVRRHPSARRMTLRISRTRRSVIMTLPVQCDIDQAGHFLRGHLDWVRQHLGQVPQPVPFADGAIIPYRGETHALAFTGAACSRYLVRVEPRAGKMPVIAVAGARDAAAGRLTEWLGENARRALDERVQVHAQRLGVRPKRISIRDQASRWGSCSTTRVLSFSWRLILAPAVVLDYVAAHEVAHLAEMNHGPKFWSLVERTMPGMRDARDWLRDFGMDLHRYGQA